MLDIKDLHGGMSMSFKKVEVSILILTFLLKEDGGHPTLCLRTWRWACQPTLLRRWRGIPTSTFLKEGGVPSILLEEAGYDGDAHLHILKGDRHATMQIFNAYYCICRHDVYIYR